MENKGMIYELIGKAIGKIGAIGKEKKNAQQGFMYRGIDQVYNALNPVMAELGIFFCPEVLDQKREERTTKNGTVLTYTLLTMKYTAYAPDGSSVSMTVVGEGMDSGDKASNKAMSVALKYACFQLFMIPTEEMVDPDAETHEVTSRAQTPAPPRAAQQEKIAAQKPANVTTVATLPQQTTPQPVSPVLEYLAKEREALRVVREIGKAENNAIWKAQVAALTEANLAPAKPLTEYTQQEAEFLIDAMYKNFAPKGTVLKDDGKAS